jgi:hypothetical protein
MAPQVGLEPHPEIPIAEAIVLKIVKNTRKTSVDAGFEGVFDLSLKAGKSCQVGGRQYKSSTFWGHENRSCRFFGTNHAVCAQPLVGLSREEPSKGDGYIGEQGAEKRLNFLGTTILPYHRCPDQPDSSAFLSGKREAQ